MQKFENEIRLIIEKNESQKNYYENVIIDIQKNQKEELQDVEDKIKKALCTKYLFQY